MDVDSFLVTVNQYHIDNLKVGKKNRIALEPQISIQEHDLMSRVIYLTCFLKSLRHDGW